MKEIKWDEDRQGFFDIDGNEYTEPEARRQLYIDTHFNEEITAERQSGEYDATPGSAAGGIGIIVLLIAIFGIGYYVGHSTAEEKIVYQPTTEYIKDPDSVSKSTLNSEVSNAKKVSYNEGYAQGLKVGKGEGYAQGLEIGKDEGYAQGLEVGKDEGYKSGHIQGTEYGKSLILNQIDLRVQEAERTNKNIPLFKVKRE
ncbi:MAG: hypothetical protein LBP76_01485 [Treponema sp.]|jgi:hypothetical protein|nr:hypothetical protein [Treponema sp.]